jgi:nitrite reductase (NADH) large subunit
MTHHDRADSDTGPVARSRVVVVGHGMVGHRFVQAAVDRGLTATHDVVVLGEEPRAAYDRVALSSWFDTRDAGDLALLPDGRYDSSDVDLRTSTVVTAVDRETCEVVLADGTRVGYDQLVLATGAAPFVPPVAGTDLDGCFVYRTIEDLEAITEAAGRARTGVVVGGGLLGLEAAHALIKLGLHTHVVEMAPRLMPVQLDDAAGATLVRHVEELGVTLHLGAATAAVTGPDAVSGLELADGSHVDADLVVFSAGIRPRDALARGAGLEVGERGGVVVDERCRTADERIWAIGECAAPDGHTYGLAAPGYDMAEVVVDAMLGGPAVFTGADMSTKLKLLGVDVASFGDAFGVTPGARELVWSDAVAGEHKKLVVDADGGRLLGGILVGDASAYGVLRPMVTSGVGLPEHPEQLILRPERGGTAGPGVAGLPDEAQVCSCNNVSKGVLLDALDDATGDHGCADVGCLKACTRAGTTCGSCVGPVKQLLEHHFAQVGKEVSRAVCEHFDLSRQELWDVVAVQGLRTFEQVLRAHGRGRGCDLCKPAIASILATQFNEHVLDPAHAGQQDTNDAYLANIQRNGSYSVVPRIPGGEVTPDKLIVLGEVAREFGLYTKITGGQRIDLFGARMEQLPVIWRRLVDAGFESGHAYGKALRTVKSCVGSTWCRYGVQDSVGMAIRLELRYRGLRSPHKLKGGVSGCARECAEARAKDFGVIATEAGWNLYVGGNGGATPAHARLLAGDLDDETLVRYLDRYLMFYVRTADRLQRTAPWIDSLDGGLDHVREVVVEDALGLGSELEAAMARHVASYADEWRATLEDPDKLARFVSFVNAPGTPDPNITFDTERDQSVPGGPATEEAAVTLGASIPVGPPPGAALEPTGGPR